jgi:hypothetical protein
MLPPNLASPNGGARKLTMNPADRAYREQWQAIAEKFRKSSAVVSKGVTSPCVPCQAKAAAAKIPPILLPSKGGKKIQVGQSPVTVVASEPPNKPVQHDEPCKHQTLTVECADFGERHFRLELPPHHGTVDGGDNQFEVIDNGKEEITCTTKIIAGPCAGIHKNKVFDIYPDDSVVSRTDSKLVFKPHRDPDLRSRPFSWLFVAAKERTAHTYDIRTNSCQTHESLSASVLVHPQLDWDVDISLGFADGEDSQLEFSGKVAAIVVGKRIEFGAEIQRELNDALEFLTVAKKTAEFLTSVCTSLGGVKIEFKFPHASFKGKWGLAEIEASPKCGFQSDVTVGFKPLVGASVTLDIITFLVTKFPGIGQMVERIREAVKKHVDVAIFFRVDGSVDGTFHYKKVADQDADGTGNMDGSLEFTLEGHVSVEEHVLFLHFGAEAKIGGKASFEAHLSAGSDEHGLYGTGGIEFAGLTIYAVAAANGKITWSTPPEEEMELSGDENEAGVAASMKVSNLGISGDVLYRKEWTVIEKRQLLGGEDKHYLFGGASV